MGFSDVFKKAFPFISAAAGLGGPLGTMAATAFGKAIGVDGVAANQDGMSDALTAAMSKDPDVMLKLKQAEQDFALQMQELGFKQVDDLLNMDVADRANARAREVAVRDNTPKILAYGVVALAAGAEGYMLIHGIKTVDPSAAVIVGRILGTLDTALVMVLSYYFGSSSGSQAKDATIHAAVVQQTR